VNAKGVARLAALRAGDGAAQVASDLNHTLAQAAVESEPGEIDLSASIDREVKGADVTRLLEIARGAGVNRLEILLTRGARPALVPNGPPEIGIVLPSDFVALPAELADDGLALPPDEGFGRIAPDLVSKALASGRPVRLAARRSR
jgi:hypothetical protein